MNYFISSERLIPSGNSNTVVQVEIWAASVDDIPGAAAVPGEQLAPGSIAIVPSTSSIYVLDFDNVWKIWGKEGGESE